MRLCLGICTLVLMAMIAPLCVAGETAEREVWFVIEFSGTPVGIGHDRWVTTDEGVYYENTMEIRARRLGTPIELFSRMEEWDDDARGVRRFETETSINGEWIRTSGERRGDRIYLATRGATYAQADTVDWDDDAVGMARVDDELRRRLRGGAADFIIKMFDPRFSGVRASRFVVRVAETGEDGMVVDQFDDGTDVPVATLWIDGNYDIQRMESEQLNMTLSMRRVAPEDIAGLTLDPNFDMIREQMIACEGYPARPWELDEVEFRLTFSRPFADASGFSGPNQRVLARDDSTMTLLVSRAEVPRDATDEAPAPYFLEPGRYVQSDDPAIRAVADSIAAATGGDDAGLARAITAWVGGYITEKTYGRGFSSAADVLASRAGDCSEHSVLLAAVLRAAGIPARIAVGLAYDDGNLIGHMWTEAYAGRWITLDALDPDNDPKRIRIAASTDERAIDETEVVNAYGVVAGLEVEVVAYKARQRGPDGR